MKNHLEELRKARGIRQEDLARDLQVSRQTISSLEKGRYNPSIQLDGKCNVDCCHYILYVREPYGRPPLT